MIPVKQYHVSNSIMLEIVGKALKRGKDGAGTIPRNGKLMRMYYCVDGEYWVVEVENLDHELGIPSKF